MKNINEEELAISERFFKAIDYLVQTRKLRGLQTFARLYGENQGNMAMRRNHPERWALKTVFLLYLARDFNISSEWLLLGRGDMLAPAE